MVKKVQKSAAGPRAEAAAAPAAPANGLLDGQFAQLVKDSAQQIWSAGLAAFAKAQNASSQGFDDLAAEGARLQKKASAAEVKLGEVASRMTDMAGEVGSRAGQHWDKLESIFEDRVARALHRLGVPSAADLTALSERLDALTAALSASGAIDASAESSKIKTPKVAKPPKAPKPAKVAKQAKAVKAVKAAKADKPATVATRTPSKSASKKPAAKATATASAKTPAKPRSPATRATATAAPAPRRAARAQPR